MSRRAFLCGAISTALAEPLAVAAQQAGRVYRIGFLSRGDDAVARPLVSAFRAGLRALGYTEGDNLIIEWRWAGEDHDRLRAMALELVRAGMDVIVSVGTWRQRGAASHEHCPFGHGPCR